MRCDPDEFRALPLEVHAFLKDVPLRDVTAMNLPGGGPGRTMADVRALLPEGPGASGNLATRMLFGLRRAAGKVFGWDRPEARATNDVSYLDRVSPSLAARSSLRPGSAQSFFVTLYALEHEMLVEARNATVHAFLASALIPKAAGGYRLYWAVYVKPVSWRTPVYMALIEPFRRYIVYPSLFRRMHRNWCARYPTLPTEVAPTGRTAPGEPGPDGGR